MDHELKTQLKLVLTSLQMLLPKPVAAVDWSVSHAANWRRHSFSGHLLPEFETDNRGAMLINNEMHHGEAIEEKISLSGRFGLWIGFHPFSQEQYLNVTRQWVNKLFAKQGSALTWNDDTRAAAVQWGYDKGDTSDRIAYQFACRWVGTRMLAQGTAASP